MESNVRRPIPSSAAQKGDKVANESNAQVEGDREEDATRMVIPLHFDRSNQQYSIVIEGADEQPPVEGSRESSADGDAPQTIPVHIGKRKQQYRLIFGLRGGHSQPRPRTYGLLTFYLHIHEELAVSADPYDDSEATRYSYDKVGEELAPSARFYKAYNDKAVDFDAEVMEEYRDSIDVLPVFVSPRTFCDVPCFIHDRPVYSPLSSQHLSCKPLRTSRLIMPSCLRSSSLSLLPSNALRATELPPIASRPLPSMQMSPVTSTYGSTVYGSSACS